MSDDAVVQRGDVVIAEVADARGHEIRKVRPWVVLSPNDLNAIRSTYIVAPLTAGHHPYRYRVPCKFRERAGHVVLDQLRGIDASLVSKPVGKLPLRSLRDTLSRLQEMFAE